MTFHRRTDNISTRLERTLDPDEIGYLENKFNPKRKKSESNKPRSQSIQRAEGFIKSGFTREKILSSRLTKIEETVLLLVIQGKSNSIIADKLSETGGTYSESNVVSFINAAKKKVVE
jgi:DNA-binding NarL/FixJ family response regulator